MKSNDSIGVIGGYDQISFSFYNEILKSRKESIFINLNEEIKTKGRIYNIKIFELKKIFDTLKSSKIKNVIFLGKINRPNLQDFKNDGEIEKYIPLLFKTFKKGDGQILNSVIKIFINNGFNVLGPNKISDKFFLKNTEIHQKKSKNDKEDINKSIKILNDLAKYDNAQSVTCVNGFIVAIEAAEGTDSLLKRTALIRKNFKHLNIKAGLLTKLPKKNQSRLVDLPVIGPKTLKLIKKANLNGMAINPKLTMVHKKEELISLAKEYSLKIYDLS